MWKQDFLASPSRETFRWTLVTKEDYIYSSKQGSSTDARIYKAIQEIVLYLPIYISLRSSWEISFWMIYISLETVTLALESCSVHSLIIKETILLPIETQTNPPTDKVTPMKRKSTKKYRTFNYLCITHPPTQVVWLLVFVVVTYKLVS